MAVVFELKDALQVSSTDGTSENIAGFKGQLQYWHYNMNETKDVGWGCGYRTLQSMISWLRLQRYTSSPVPTHLDIQKMLVLSGEKSNDFVESREWIGTVEAGRVLQLHCNTDFRIIELPSGHDALKYDFVQSLILHFQNIGSPIMCGGTRDNISRAILAVKPSPKVKDTKILIMDPHYIATFKESIPSSDAPACLRFLFSKGWISWRSITMFSKESHYNLCCPIPNSTDEILTSGTNTLDNGCEQADVHVFQHFEITETGYDG
eukprot:gene498-3824_t